MLSVSLSHVLERGVRLESGEAVAIAQLLIEAPGLPTIDNVELRSDGSAVCLATGDAADVKDVASLLQQLLPPDAKIPAALRYTIARGLGIVEAPPFDSLAAFSTSLRRFEARERGTIVRALLARASRVAPEIVPAELLEKPLEAAVLRPLVIPPVPSAARAPVVPAIEADLEPAASMPLDQLPRIPSAAAAPPRPVPVTRRTGWRAAAVAAGLLVSALGGYTVASWRQRADVTSTTTVTSATAPASRPSEGGPASASVPASRRTEVPTATAGRVEVPSAKPAAAAAVRPAPAVSARAPELGTAAPRDSKAPLQPYRALPSEDLPALSPSFAANGSAMFFQTGGPGAARSAIAMAAGAGWPGADLRIVKVVDDGARNYHAQPSPDGRFIAFDSDRDGIRAVYVADRDGSRVRRVSEPGYAAVPTWSPDGARLAYIRAEAGKPSVWNLWVQPIAGGPARRVTNFRSGQTWGGSWFPDNRRIAYSHENSLRIVDLVTGQTREFASPVRGRLVRTPAVSPDGTKVVFQVYRSGAWMVDLRDGSMQCVLADLTAEEFAWAPDGRRIAFHSKRDGEWGIYVMPRG